ncbi:2-octaprenyl-6-methoxyphenyl hydroxylase [Tahibacter amnicola]|uniref:2-octaprenyl-6-methoxyphenyl hydroxylase n=1 Tax=Tahibacter amnicola TaxID=2976241 RepID=A0ABY6BFN6_9GAMM|nr:2-octaprenyl-6-methoxyphenyl hydroxylase [Tahibacter amnicola]UXI67421.1 2-octaprenyl-6-methoxyphenyl hydroxylase [Tahibacter amnicola]
MSTDFDVVVVGGGLVGASLAIALEDSDLRVALVEAAAPRAAAQPSYDERNLALARASVAALGTLGVWQHVGASASPIRRIHVSRAGEFGTVRLDSERQGLPDFGAVLPARELGNGLLAQLERCRRLVRYAPASVEHIQPGDRVQTLSIRSAGEVTTLSARLVIGADGTESLVRQRSGVTAEEHDYGQVLFVCTVMPERPLDGTAYERFSDEGPVALLPLAERRAGLVLTVSGDQSAQVESLDDESFLALAQARFGWRAGRLRRPGRRTAYRMRRVSAQQLVAPRTVLVGNAAQTLHPIGAQGFNLGLRDALTLAEKLITARRRGDDIGAPAVLRDYALARQADRDGTLDMSDGLVRLACNPASLLGPLRSVALLAIDGLPPLARWLSRRGMGYRGVPNRYSSGDKP